MTRLKQVNNTATKVERLGVVSYTNVAPLHFSLRSSEHLQFVYGVPTELNAQLLAGEIDLTLISSAEFIRHRQQLKALPDFSIANYGEVQSVMLFHKAPLMAGQHLKLAVSSHSASSVALLDIILNAKSIDATVTSLKPDLEVMLEDHDAALLIGDGALRESVMNRQVQGQQLYVTDLAKAWYELCGLPFTFAVWASHKDNPPTPELVADLRAARFYGLGHLANVSQAEVPRLSLEASVIQNYLSQFRYFLKEPDRQGLFEFARKLEPSIDTTSLQFWDL